MYDVLLSFLCSDWFTNYTNWLVWSWQPCTILIYVVSVCNILSTRRTGATPRRGPCESWQIGREHPLEIRSKVKTTANNIIPTIEEVWSNCKFLLSVTVCDIFAIKMCSTLNVPLNVTLNVTFRVGQDEMKICQRRCQTRFPVWW